MNILHALATGILLACTLLQPLNGQRLSTDIRHLLHAAQTVTDTSYDHAAIDTLIMELAYYAAAPDTNAALSLCTGPSIVDHYSKNEEMSRFLAKKGLDTILWVHRMEAVPSFAWLDNLERSNFLRKPQVTELFSRNGLIDVEKIQAAYTSPLPPMDNALPAAVDGAKQHQTPVPSANYISVALTGLSDWISKRAQEELTYTFLNRLRKELEENDLEYLFPNTVAYLPTLNLINYKSILPSIRLAFAKDLNQISLNLGNFLNEKDPAAYTNPAVYNLFIVYRLLDLGVRGVPLSDMLAFTYGEISDTRLNLRRNIDLKLAKSAETSTEYSSVMTAYNELVSQLKIVKRNFQSAKSDLSDIEEDIVDLHGEAAVRPLRPRIDKVLDFDFGDLLFTHDEAPEVVRSWLLGKPAYDYFIANPSITKYDEFFGADQVKLDTAGLRAAGLTAVRELLTRKDQLNLRFQDLLDARYTLDSMKEVLSRPVPETDAAALKQSLTRRLADEMAYFSGRPDSTRLRFLSGLLQEVLPELDGSLNQLQAISDRLNDFSNERGQEGSPNYLRLHPPLPLKAAYSDIEASIGIANAQFAQMYNALNSYSQDNAGDLIRAHRNAANFETLFGLGKEMFFLLFDRPPPQAMKKDTGRIKPEFAEMGTLTNFMLNTDADQLVRGLARERLSRVPGLGQLDGSGIGKFVISFTEQLAALKAPLPESVKDKRTAARIKTVAFITGTVSRVIEADFLRDPDQPGKSMSLADLLPGFAKVPEINDNLEELFRLSQSGQFRYAITNLINLVDLFGIIPPASKKQQRLSEQRNRYRTLVNDLREVSLNNNYDGLALNSHSLSKSDSLQHYLNYYGEELERLDKKLERLDTTRANRNRQQLFLYGTFMADVAAADTPEAFAAALNNVALPPGSSQLKRNKPFSLELNAYFGMAYSREMLDFPEELTGTPGLPKEDASTLALFVPVGMSVSWKLSYQRKSSYSLFFPLIDLGAVSAYRLDDSNDQVERLPRFTFQNVFAPGAHLFYNLGNTPFSFGVGAQYGPTTRRIMPDGAPAFNASGIRYMATFSVDVPIFSFTNRQ